jgi:hypothetical protein
MGPVMDLLSRLSDPLADSRLGFNLIAIHGVITFVVLISLLLRRLINHGGSQLGRWTGLRWLTAAGEEAARRARVLLFWLTVGVVLVAVAAGAIYHLLGRDIRLDLNEWYEGLTIAELTRLGLRVTLAVATAAAAWIVGRNVQRGLVWKTRSRCGSAWRQARR